MLNRVIVSILNLKTRISTILNTIIHLNKKQLPIYTIQHLNKKHGILRTKQRNKNIHERKWYY